MTTQTNQLLLDGIHSSEPVAGLTHGFYRYPARFSPHFTRAAILAFTQPGDVVYDPFMGGGTTIVEATALGRQAVGTDINSLAVFLSEVKTTVFPDREIATVHSWANAVVPKLNVWSPAQRAHKWEKLGYQRNINSPETWRIRKLLEIALAEIKSLNTVEQQRFARCIILKTAQWALDCRKDIPAVEDFRHQFLLNAGSMAHAAKQYARVVRRAGTLHQPVCLQRSAIGVETDLVLARHRPISLVLTSPPYPGVHVLYHRWQVRGRRETPAPFWIASSLDGNGAAYYTFGDRKAERLDSYFNDALAAFRSLSRIVENETIIVQMVAFSEPGWQLPRYVSVMEQAGFREIMFPEMANKKDGRVWRAVPNRKWYASQRGITSSSDEVVLFHKLAPPTS